MNTVDFEIYSVKNATHVLTNSGHAAIMHNVPESKMS